MTGAPTPHRNRIVVGVDGSQASIDALKTARQVATVFDAELDAVIAWHYPVINGMAPMLAEFDPSADAVEILHTALGKAFLDDLPVGLRQLRQQGHPAKVLTDAAADATMLVVGSRGHGGFAGLLLGSTSAYCVEHATCPVLVVHAGTSVF